MDWPSLICPYRIYGHDNQPWWSSIFPTPSQCASSPVGSSNHWEALVSATPLILSFPVAPAITAASAAAALSPETLHTRRPEWGSHGPGLAFVLKANATRCCAWEKCTRSWAGAVHARRKCFVLFCFVFSNEKKGRKSFDFGNVELTERLVREFQLQPKTCVADLFWNTRRSNDRSKRMWARPFDPTQFSFFPFFLFSSIDTQQVMEQMCW
jgi:hypothetical protein